MAWTSFPIMMAFFNAVILLGFYDVVSIRAVFHSINHPFYSIPCVLLFSHLVVSDSLLPYGLQPASLLCLSPSLRVCPSSCPLNWWYLGHLVDGILLWQPGVTDTDREGFVIKSATVHRVTKSQTWLKWLSIHARLLFLKFHSVRGSWKALLQRNKLNFV